MISVLVRREETQRQTHAQGRWCADSQGEPLVTMEVETGVVNLTAKEQQGALAAAQC